MRLLLALLACLLSAKFASAQLITSVTFAPPVIVGGQNSTGTITFPGPWDSGLTDQATLSSDSTAVSVPATIMLVGGQTSVTFTATTAAVTMPITAHITVTIAGNSAVGTLTVVPFGLTSFSIGSNPNVGGAPVTVSLAISAAAPTGGTTLSLTSSNANALPLPASVTIPAGSTSVSVSVPTSTVNSTTKVNCTASDGTVTLLTTLTLTPGMLWVTDLYMPNSLRLQWNVTATGNCVLKRDGATIATITNGANFYIDSFTFNTGQAYRYDICDSNAPTIPLASELVTLYRNDATGNQAVDSRLDLRYATNVFLDHHFGSSVYRGGLFVGYAQDPARVGRSFANFTLSSETVASYRAGSVNIYFMGAYTRANASSTVTIGCQLVAPITGIGDLVWSIAPAINPASATHTITITYTPAAPNPQWITWGMSDEIKAYLGAPLALAFASTSESSNVWAYLAKKEYDASKAPTILHAHCQPVLFKQTLSPNPLTPTSTSGSGDVTGKLFINGIGPTDSVTVALSCDHPELLSNFPSSVTVTGLNKTYTFRVGQVTAQTTIHVTAKLSRTETDFDTITTVLVINPPGSGGGGPGGPGGP